MNTPIRHFGSGVLHEVARDLENQTFSIVRGHPAAGSVERVRQGLYESLASSAVATNGKLPVRSIGIPASRIDRYFDGPTAQVLATLYRDLRGMEKVIEKAMFEGRGSWHRSPAFQIDELGVLWRPKGEDTGVHHRKSPSFMGVALPDNGYYLHHEEGKVPTQRGDLVFLNGQDMEDVTAGALRAAQYGIDGREVSRVTVFLRLTSDSVYRNLNPDATDVADLAEKADSAIDAFS